MKVADDISLNSIAEFAAFLAQYCQGYENLLLAYSGGLDSHVLLHLLVGARVLRPSIKLSAVHINHGLHIHAEQWANHCRNICTQLNVTFYSHSLSLTTHTGESIEALARHARYQILLDYQATPHCILTAQHQDDQAETLLLQLLRGSGPRGLAAMPPSQAFGIGILCRPLLHLSRRQLMHYAVQHQLQWVEDDSNTNLQFSRNYLRHQVLPMLQQRWPATAASLARSARHCADTLILLDDLAQQDLSQLITVHVNQEVIDNNVLLKLSLPRQCNVLRYWIRSHGYQVPNESRLLTFLRNLTNSAPDKMPQLVWGTWVIRRFRHYLYLLRQEQLTVISAQEITWDLHAPLILPQELGTLSVSQVARAGLNPVIKNNPLSIRFQQVADSIRPKGSAHRRSLKKLWQHWGVPPWERLRTPLLYSGDKLVSVVGYCIADEFAVDNAPGLIIKWQKNV